MNDVIGARTNGTRDEGVDSVMQFMAQCLPNGYSVLERFIELTIKANVIK